MVGSVFTTIGEVITGYLGAISNMFNSVVALFYNAETGLTLLGTLLLIGFGICIVVWGVNLVRGLIRL